MICPICRDAGEKSTLWSGGTHATLMGWRAYFDEDGKEHQHDPNKRSTDFQCSNGHEFTYLYVNPCASCSYGKDTGQYRMEGDKEWHPLHGAQDAQAR